MTDEKDLNNGGAGSDDSATKAADDSVKNNGSGDGSKDENEVITVKKSEFEQIKSDRDNYRNSLLTKKADERDLKNNQAKNDSGDNGQNNSSVIDEKRITETAIAATNKVIRDASEKTAKRAFLKDHSEYIDDTNWSTLMSHLTLKGNEVTHDDILDRMEAAVLEHKRSTGKLEEYLKSEHERGLREGRIQGELGSGYGAVINLVSLLDFQLKKEKKCLGICTLILRKLKKLTFQRTM
jgi:hypothetical protein